jgi:ComF family protein
MLNIITKFLDILFPPRKSELIVRETTAETVRTLYTPSNRNAITYLSAFRNEIIHALITENKYFSNRYAAQMLGVILETHFYSQQNYVLIAIPLHKARERERGYNQVVRVIKETGLPFADNIIFRTKATTSQTKLSKSERIKNTRNAFTVDETVLANYEHTHFVLVDDVLTTGATLQAARAELAPHIPPSCTLSCLALAH